jgi:hypothetical protein
VKIETATPSRTGFRGIEEVVEAAKAIQWLNIRLEVVTPEGKGMMNWENSRNRQSRHLLYERFVFVSGGFAEALPAGHHRGSGKS